ncbi:hypothetical protein ASPFODRAFT_53098 [Aspergillus luchuensis CBS 106.47]|uniref:Uncharacterized protein n=1 Tax=Aspergillus luchuensis (strain CBS 106.47) TaxID=1137211 RepID=A0A1M3T1A9_ASPLC|nr:hypothetical protein ASPFODRAFT_53098 [Aspergillus luchuensis CBS 106.47]
MENAHLILAEALQPRLIFEVQDIIEAGTPIHWAYFCHGLHELLLQEDWYCNSGLYLKGRILHLTERLKECFLESVESYSMPFKYRRKDFSYCCSLNHANRSNPSAHRNGMMSAYQNSKRTQVKTMV